MGAYSPQAPNKCTPYLSGPLPWVWRPQHWSILDGKADVPFPELSKGPESDSYPEPYEFTKRELVAACRQGMKLHGSGERYPRPWRHKNSNEVTNYVAFPILPGQRLWTGGEPGRYRIVYNKIDGSFYRIIMHLYTTPLAEREIPVVGSGWPGDMSGSENTHQPGHIRSPSLPHARLIKSPPTEAMNQWPNQAGRRGSRYA
jgi:hypothetical protein